MAQCEPAEHAGYGGENEERFPLAIHRGSSFSSAAERRLPKKSMQPRRRVRPPTAREALSPRPSTLSNAHRTEEFIGRVRPRLQTLRPLDLWTTYYPHP